MTAQVLSSTTAHGQQRAPKKLAYAKSSKLWRSRRQDKRIPRSWHVFSLRTGSRGGERERGREYNRNDSVYSIMGEDNAVHVVFPARILHTAKSSQDVSDGDVSDVQWVGGAVYGYSPVTHLKSQTGMLKMSSDYTLRMRIVSFHFTSSRTSLETKKSFSALLPGHWGECLEALYPWRRRGLDSGGYPQQLGKETTLRALSQTMSLVWAEKHQWFSVAPITYIINFT